MTRRGLPGTHAFIIAMALLSLPTVHAGGQTPPARARSKPPVAKPAKVKAPAIPRTPDGRPDLEGVWDYRSLTPLQRPAEFAGRATLTDEDIAKLERRQAEGAGPASVFSGDGAGGVGSYEQFWYDMFYLETVEDRRTSLIMDPPDGRLPPMTPAGQARAARRRSTDGPEAFTPQDRCLLGVTSGPPMVPGAYNNYMQLVQTPQHVVIFNEMVHEARIVPLDGRPHGPLRRWTGDSRGRWEGDTLVVETINFRPEGLGPPSSFHPYRATGSMRLVERFTRTAADTLRYEFTMEDPTVWTRPWTAMIPMKKSDLQIYEYACHEGNYGMTNGLEAARFEEKAAATNPPK